MEIIVKTLLPNMEIVMKPLYPIMASLLIIHAAVYILIMAFPLSIVAIANYETIRVLILTIPYVVWTNLLIAWGWNFKYLKKVIINQ